MSPRKYVYNNGVLSIWCCCCTLYCWYAMYYLIEGEQWHSCLCLSMSMSMSMKRNVAKKKICLSSIFSIFIDIGNDVVWRYCGNDTVLYVVKMTCVAWRRRGNDGDGPCGDDPDICWWWWWPDPLTMLSVVVTWYWHWPYCWHYDGIDDDSPYDDGIDDIIYCIVQKTWPFPVWRYFCILSLPSFSLSTHSLCCWYCCCCCGGVGGGGRTWYMVHVVFFSSFNISFI